MTWELALVAAAAAPSAAAVVIVGIWSAHRRWSAARDERVAAQCPHVWSKWKAGKVTEIFADEDDEIPTDREHRFARQCELCGDTDFKVWSNKRADWK